jgi:hypothetical protein
MPRDYYAPRSEERRYKSWERYYWLSWYFCSSAHYRRGHIVLAGVIILAAAWVLCSSLSLSCCWWEDSQYKWVADCSPSSTSNSEADNWHWWKDHNRADLRSDYRASPTTTPNMTAVIMRVVVNSGRMGFNLFQTALDFDEFFWMFLLACLIGVWMRANYFIREAQAGIVRSPQLQSWITSNE